MPEEIYKGHSIYIETHKGYHITIQHSDVKYINSYCSEKNRRGAMSFIKLGAFKQTCDAVKNLIDKNIDDMNAFVDKWLLVDKDGGIIVAGDLCDKIPDKYNDFDGIIYKLNIAN